MGANPTQAQGFVLFLIAFVFLAAAFATGSILYVVFFVAFLGGALALFMKCKPWENQGE